MAMIFPLIAAFGWLVIMSSNMVLSYPIEGFNVGNQLKDIFSDRTLSIDLSKQDSIGQRSASLDKGQLRPQATGTGDSFPYPQCYSFALSQMEQLFSTCGNAVPYSFYLPANTSLTALDATAKAILGNPGLAVLPNACQVAMKKTVCAKIYLRCHDNVTLTNQATFNYNIYSDLNLTIPLPFQRPCKSLCDDVNTKCLGLLSLLGVNSNCSARADYSGGSASLLPYQYDQRPNSDRCNAMTVSSFSIGSSKEVYISGSSGACYGIVDEVYIPPSSSLSSSLAPLLPPYVIQSIIEAQLKASFDALPAWMSENCHLALKKYFCRSYLIKPHGVAYSEALTTSGAIQYLSYFIAKGIDVTSLAAETVYIPSFPSQEVCQDYQDTCAAFITLADAPSLIPNCSATSSATGVSVQLFPSSNQTILTLPIPLSDSLTIFVDFGSSPDHVSNAMDSYETTCPSGFVVPDEPDDERITWIPGTGCANQCR